MFSSVLKATAAILFCCFSLTSSITWHPMVIEQHYDRWPQSAVLFHQALSLNNPQARLVHYRNNPQWSLDDKVNWLSHAVLKRNSQAHFHLAENWYQAGQTTRAIVWLKSAIGQGHQAASLLYVKILIEKAEYLLAEKVLNSPVLYDDDRVKLLLSQLYLHQNLIEKADSLLNKLADKNILGAAGLLADLNGLRHKELKSKTGCSVNIQFVVSGFAELNYAADIMTKWQQDTSINTLPVCFNQTIEFDPKRLNCNDLSDQKQHCDLTLMAAQLSLPKRTLPVIVHGQAGIANYNNGLIFLNSHKSFGVFKHELFHHFGFIDEYPLQQQTAASLCNVQMPRFVGENLYIVPENQLDLHRPKNMTAVSTCQGMDVVAFKPVTTMTLMEYVDEPLPEAYLQRAKSKLLNNSLLPNYQYAYALAFEQNGQRAQYLQWLTRSANQGYEVAAALLEREKQTLVFANRVL
jgi:hypothetical protein